MTALVIGASGQVGHWLYRICRHSVGRFGNPSRAVGRITNPSYNTAGTYCRHFVPGLIPLDLNDRSAVESLIRDVRPAVCYLPGSMTHVDHAERNADGCWAVNVEGALRVAQAMQRVGGKLVYFSTDHVFADSRRAWREEESPHPMSVYAKSKWEAEQMIRQLLPNAHLILRTSWVFGPDPQEKNFLWRVFQTLERGDELVVPKDQYGSPTYGPDLARAAFKLQQDGANGTFHVVGPRCLSRLTWARMIAKQFELPADLIRGVPTEEMRSIAPRPMRVQLDRQKLVDCLDHDPVRSPMAGLRDFQRKLARSTRQAAA